MLAPAPFRAPCRLGVLARFAATFSPLFGFLAPLLQQLLHRRFSRTDQWRDVGGLEAEGLHELRLFPDLFVAELGGVETEKRKRATDHRQPFVFEIVEDRHDCLRWIAESR
jgi:hypothetical protein